jgi:hypothetical protein
VVEAGNGAEKGVGVREKCGNGAEIVVTVLKKKGW